MHLYFHLFCMHIFAILFSLLQTLQSNNAPNCFETAFEPPCDKTSKMVCVPSKDSDQPGHPPSLIRAFAVRSMCS